MEPVLVSPAPSVDPSQPHVENLDRPLGVDQQVRRLDVAMNDTLLVSELQPARRLNDAPDSMFGRQGPVLLDELRQVVPLNELHDQEVRAVGFVGIVGGDDIGMFELRRRLHLALKPLHGIGRFHGCRRHHLQRHHPPHPLVHRLEHHSHPSLA